MTYFSNSCESDFLDNQCHECLIGMDNYCPVWAIQMDYNYKQVVSNGRGQGHIPPILYGIMETLIKGGVCQVKRAIDER